MPREIFIAPIVNQTIAMHHGKLVTSNSYIHYIYYQNHRQENRRSVLVLFDSEINKPVSPLGFRLSVPSACLAPPHTTF